MSDLMALPFQTPPSDTVIKTFTKLSRQIVATQYDPTFASSLRGKRLLATAIATVVKTALSNKMTEAGIELGEILLPSHCFWLPQAGPVAGIRWIWGPSIADVKAVVGPVGGELGVGVSYRRLPDPNEAAQVNALFREAWGFSIPLVDPSQAMLQWDWLPLSWLTLPVHGKGLRSVFRAMFEEGRPGVPLPTRGELERWLQSDDAGVRQAAVQLLPLVE